MPEAIALPLLGGISAITGALGGTKTSSSSTPAFTTEQQSMQHNLSDAISTQLNNPTSLAPQQVAAASEVNNNYANVQKQLQAQFSGRGFGRSGSLVTQQQGVDIAKAGAQGNLASQFAQMQLNQTNQVDQEAQQFGFAAPGNNSTGTSGPSSPFGAGLGSGMSTVTTMFMLNKLLQGNGQGGIWN